MDSQILMYQARVHSLVCQLESMKVDNEKAKAQGDAPHWSSDHFDGLANDFQRLSEVEVQGYNRQVISEDTKCPLYWMEYIIENLDENYGCEESWGEYTPSEETMTHWKQFVKSVIKEYPVSRLKEVGKPFKVNIKEVLGE